SAVASHPATQVAKPSGSSIRSSGSNSVLPEPLFASGIDNHRSLRPNSQPTMACPASCTAAAQRSASGCSVTARASLDRLRDQAEAARWLDLELLDGLLDRGLLVRRLDAAEILIPRADDRDAPLAERPLVPRRLLGHGG